MNKNNHLLYLSLFLKYNNNLIPDLPRILLSYILQNPDKRKTYLSDSISTELILAKIAEVFSKSKQIDVLNEIIKFVEVDKCKMN